MEVVLSSLNSSSLNSIDSILLDSVSLGSLIIFAAVGMVAYSVSIHINHPVDPILLKFTNPQRYFLSNGFLSFAIINFTGILLIFTSIFLECCEIKGLSYFIPFLLLLIGVWWITIISIRDLLWRMGR